jgi:hypothetical protein
MSLANTVEVTLKFGIILYVLFSDMSLAAFGYKLLRSLYPNSFVDFHYVIFLVLTARVYELCNTL